MTDGRSGSFVRRRRPAQALVTAAALVAAVLAIAVPVVADLPGTSTTGTSPHGAGPTGAGAEPPDRDPAEPSPSAVRTGGQDLMKLRPFAPSDTSLFSRTAFPGSGPMVPAVGPAPTEAHLARRLGSTLARRCPNRVARGLTLFLADPALRKTVPDPNLRAAASSLLCTYGEPAVTALRDGTFSRVGYGKLPADTSAEVGSSGEPEDAPYITVNKRYRYEDFRTLAAVVFHETLHQDEEVTNKEELINSALDALVQAQQYLSDPRPATSGTELTRWVNAQLLARINSGSGTRLGLFTMNRADPDYPGGAPRPFAAVFEPLGDDTPGNSVLRETLALIARAGAAPPPTAGFDDRTLDFLDAHQGLTADEVLRTAEILRLRTPAGAIGD
ncbi:hypothetical protein [Streptomyces sp. KR80]|uniref:hypothetical protein n=1 Tax=Streptomyces sp. KR80 TaxID=3457426 RepID=UPI003FD1DFCC